MSNETTMIAVVDVSDVNPLDRMGVKELAAMVRGLQALNDLHAATIERDKNIIAELRNRLKAGQAPIEFLADQSDLLQSNGEYICITDHDMEPGDVVLIPHSIIKHAAAWLAGNEPKEQT